MPAINLRKRIMRYLSSRIERRDVLRQFLQTITIELTDSVIFGGMIRDFGLGYARSFRSDIDIVTTSNAEEIYRLIKSSNPVRNKFGGFRFSAAGRLFDIWSFSDTWAIKEGVIKGDRIEDLCKTTFFTLDAAIFRLKDSSLMTAPKYEEQISLRILDINLVNHPFPDRVARRAIHIATAKNLSMTPALCEFIVRSIAPRRGDVLDRQLFTRLQQHLNSSPNLNFRPVEQLPIWSSDDLPHNYSLDHPYLNKIKTMAFGYYSESYTINKSFHSENTPNSVSQQLPLDIML